MNAALPKADKMTVEEKENQEMQAAPEEETAAAGELAAPRWSVVTFETVAAGNLSYDEASKLMEKLSRQKVSGLCIVTDEAAARISR